MPESVVISPNGNQTQEAAEGTTSWEEQGIPVPSPGPCILGPCWSSATKSGVNAGERPNSREANCTRLAGVDSLLIALTGKGLGDASSTSDVPTASPQRRPQPPITPDGKIYGLVGRGTTVVYSVRIRITTVYSHSVCPLLFPLGHSW